jgi:hypothetical protein
MKVRQTAILLLIIINTGIVNAQFNEAEFIYRVKTNYHSLKSTGLDNFSSWVTSNIFFEATKDVSEEDIFPLEIIWKNPDLLYYIKRPLPDAGSVEKQKEIEQHQMDLIQELQGILVDWQRFFAGNLLDELPETYLITPKEDTVFVEYELFEEGKNVKTKMIFGQNGRCLKILTNYVHKNQIIIVYPGYTIVENKWICNHWRVQIEVNQQIESGFEISLKSRKVEDYWIPQRLVMQLQKRDIDNTLFVRDYKFRNIVLNKDLQILK